METERDKPGACGALLRAAAAAAFLVSWLALLFVMLRGIEKIWPAMTTGDAPSLAAGGLLIPMAAFLIQAVIHLPRRRHKTVFLRPRSLSRFSILLFPCFKRLEIGPALSVITARADREAIVAEAERRMKYAFALTPRLALLLDNRSPLEVVLRRLMNSRTRPLSLAGRFFFLLVSPVRQFTRLWGYIFTRLWNDPGPEDELTAYKRKVAFDLARRGRAFGLDGMPPDQAQKTLAGIWKELKRIYNNPFYGQDLGDPLPDIPDDDAAASGGPVSAALSAPWLAPRYYGVYLDLSVTLAARTPAELYDSWKDEDLSVFYPPELGREVESAALLIAARSHLSKRLGERAEEGIENLDGRPIPTWIISSWLFDIENDLNYHKQRIAAHHRRCRSAHLSRARRLQKGWPEYLEGAALVLHFAEHARRALNTAGADFGRVLARPDKFSGEGLAEAARLHSLMADLHDRLIRLDLTDELEVRPSDMLPLALPSPAADFQSWLAGWEGMHGEMAAMFSKLRGKALTALLWAEDKVGGRLPGEAGGELEEAPPAPGPFPAFFSVRPPVELPERVYSVAGRLKTGFGHSFPAALLLSLLLWQGQTLGRSHLVIYNGLGRDVTVWAGREEAKIGPYGRARLDLQPGGVYDIVAATGEMPRDRFGHRAMDESSPNSAMIRSHLIEHFSRRLLPTPQTEVYNIAGAAPLMLWQSPRGPEDASGEEFLGRPQWLETRADIFFRAPAQSDEAPALVLSGYGELPPSEMLPAFSDERDRGELIYLHALWDNPGTSGFWQWQIMTFGRVQAEILIQRLAREPDFLEKCVGQLGLLGIQ